VLATNLGGSSTIPARVVRVIRVAVRCQRLVSGLAAIQVGGELAGKKEEESKIWGSSTVLATGV
jgi:hypothetical protein